LRRCLYEPETVKSVLGESRVFLQKAQLRLAVCRNGTVEVQSEYLALLNGIAGLLSFLI
jgi:hypothetical protein